MVWNAEMLRTLLDEEKNSCGITGLFTRYSQSPTTTEQCQVKMSLVTLQNSARQKTRRNIFLLQGKSVLLYSPC